MMKVAMHIVLRGCLFFVFLFPSGITYAASYSAQAVNSTSFDATTQNVTWTRTSGSVVDDDYQVVNIGFSFSFGGVSYSQVKIISNGLLHFGADQKMYAEFKNATLPFNNADRFIAPYWDDLDPSSGGNVTYDTSGTVPNRTFIVTWSNVPHYIRFFWQNRGSYSFQIVLHENGNIRFRYNSRDANGSSATIGLEVDNTNYIQYAYNTSNSVKPANDVLFTPIISSIQSVSGICGTEDSLLVKYSGNALANALVTANYTLNGATVNSASLQDSSTILLSTSTLTPGQAYTLSFAGAAGVAADFTGLMGHYYDQRTNGIKVDWRNGGLFTGKQFYRKDPDIAFDWNHAIPSVFPNVAGNADKYSVRWTGNVSPPSTGQYEFRLFSDDGMRLFLNGNLIINDWSTHSGRYKSSSPISLTKDQYTPIKVEFFEHGGRAFAHLEWRPVGGSWQVVPTSNLSTCSVPPPLPDCAKSFAAGAGSYNNGQLKLDTGVAINGSGTSLPFGSISNGPGTACGGTTCTASGASVPPLNPGIFPNTGGGGNLTINSGNSGTIGNGSTFDYKKIDIKNNGTLSVNSAVSTFYIDQLKVKKHVTLNLTAGTYWIKKFSPDDNLTINVIGGGTVRLMIKDKVDFKNNLLANSPSVGATGDPSKLLIYGYNDVKINDNSTISAAIYSQKKIKIDKGAAVFGAVTGSKVEVKKNASITYNGTAMGAINLAGVCSATTPTSCTLGSFAITQPASGLACPSTRSTVAITAMCADGVTTKTDYTGSINLTTNENASSQFYSVLTGGTAISSKAFVAADNGTTNVYLYHQNENAALTVTAADTAASVSSTAGSGTYYRTNGFAATTPANFTCGETGLMTLTAIGQTNNTAGACSVLTGFTGSKAMKSWFEVNITPGESPAVADAVTTPMSFNGTAIADHVAPAANNLTLTFNAGVANINTAYLDAGQLMALHFRHDAAPYASPNYLQGNTSTFVVRPNQVVLQVSDPLNSKDPACAGGNASCTAFVKAGTPFRITASAVCADASKTVAKSYQATVPLSLTKIAPTDVGSSAGALGAASVAFSGADNGIVVNSNQTESEVGVFTITATPPSYFASTLSPFTTTNIGRFTPDHFSVAVSSAGSFANTCSSATAFTYIGQPFNYTAAPSLTLTATNAANVTTNNYTYGFNKLLATGLTRAFPTLDNTQNGKDGATKMSLSATGVTGALVVSSPGVHNFNFSSLDSYTFTKGVNAEINPFIADLSVNLTGVVDSDGIAGLDSSNSLISAANPLVITPTGNNLRYGRWKVDSAFGPETGGLTLPAVAQYLNGSAYVTNTDDSCSDLTTATSTTPVGSPAFTNIAVGGGTTDFTFNAPLALGQGNYQFTSPGSGNTGPVTITTNLNTMPWLQYDWDGNGTLDNPANVSATFGQYRGNDRIIYWREVN